MFNGIDSLDTWRVDVRLNPGEFGGAKTMLGCSRQMLLRSERQGSRGYRRTGRGGGALRQRRLLKDSFGLEPDMSA